jgi:hypothetical protein
MLQHAPLASLATAPVFLSVIIAKQDFDKDMKDLCNPFSEAEMCDDVSTMSSEFVGFYRKSPLVANSVNFVGRVFSIAANSLSSRLLRPEQLFGQTILLCTAFHDLVKSVQVERAVASTPVTMQAKRAFHAYFGPAGLSWPQFKTMTCMAVDWVDLNEGDTITQDSLSENNEQGEHMYWLYQGFVEIQSNSSSYRVNKERPPRLSDRANQCRMGLWGDLDPTLLDLPQLSPPPKTSLCAGKGGATLMRIHVPSLADLMKSDKDLAQSIRSLVYKSTEDKAISIMLMAGIDGSRD